MAADATGHLDKFHQQISLYLYIRRILCEWF